MKLITGMRRVEDYQNLLINNLEQHEEAVKVGPIRKVKVANGT